MWYEYHKLIRNEQENKINTNNKNTTLNKKKNKQMEGKQTPNPAPLTAESNYISF